MLISLYHISTIRLSRLTLCYMYHATGSTFLVIQKLSLSTTPSNMGQLIRASLLAAGGIRLEAPPPLRLAQPARRAHSDHPLAALLLLASGGHHRAVVAPVAVVEEEHAIVRHACRVYAVCMSCLCRAYVVSMPCVQRR